MNRDAINFETEKVSVLFRKLLIPTLLGSLSISAVTAIDGIFVGHGVGASGVAAVNIAVPIYQIMSALGLTMGVGCSVVASIHLSRKNTRAAQLNSTQAIAFSSIVAALISVLVLIFPRQSALLLGASETLLPQVEDYLRFIMPCFVFDMWCMIGLFIIRLDGSPKYAMWCNLIPSALNVLLDWIFIFPLGMGVKGAAIATGLSISVGGLMAMAYLLFFAKELRLVRLKRSVKSFRLAVRNLGYQAKLGSSTLLGELILASFVFLGNIVFMKYLGDDGVGAFGIACYYTPFFFMIGNAVAQSAQPIISYNYGASRWDQVRQARRLLLITASSIGLLATAMFVGIPRQLVALFIETDSRAAQIAIQGFPYFAMGIVFYILNVAVIGYYQSIEKSRKANSLVILRGFVLLIPAFFLLPELLGERGIWLAMPVAEIISSVVILSMLLWNRTRLRQS